MAMPAAEESNDPATLHHVMQTMIADELRDRYEAPRKVPHQLFVLLMQLKEEERRLAGGKQAPKRRRQPA